MIDYNDEINKQNNHKMNNFEYFNWGFYWVGELIVRSWGVLQQPDIIIRPTNQQFSYNHLYKLHFSSWSLLMFFFFLIPCLIHVWFTLILILILIDADKYIFKMTVFTNWQSVKVSFKVAICLVWSKQARISYLSP